MGVANEGSRRLGRTRREQDRWSRRRWWDSVAALAEVLLKCRYLGFGRRFFFSAWAEFFWSRVKACPTVH
jgi:hypothetical protein